MHLRALVLTLAGLLVCGAACSSDPAGPADAAPSARDAGDLAAARADDTRPAALEAGPNPADGKPVAVDAKPATKLPCVVNQHTVPEPACGYLHEIALQIVPRLEGTRDQKLAKAAAVAWWSLKEGILSLKNPWVYSNCHFSSGDKTIGPLEICAAGQAWQVGISGSQVPGTSLTTLEGLATKLYSGSTVAKVLEQTAQKAGLDATTTQKVVASQGTLRSSWLLRAGAIGFTNQSPIVTGECVAGSKSWCYGAGWSESKLYAPTKTAALQSIQDMKDLFGKLLP